MYKHIYNHLHDNNLIYSKQSGFLKGHSTVYQLLDIYHQICQAIDAKQYTCMIFCDISKAFDRVWHKGLLFKIKQNGINGTILKWISNYLTNRNQRVFVGASLSNNRDIMELVFHMGLFWDPYFFLCMLMTLQIIYLA